MKPVKVGVYLPWMVRFDIFQLTYAGYAQIFHFMYHLNMQRDQSLP